MNCFITLIKQLPPKLYRKINIKNTSNTIIRISDVVITIKSQMIDSSFQLISNIISLIFAIEQNVASVFCYSLR